MTTHPIRILVLNALAVEYYRTCLHSPLGDGPRGYLVDRGVTPDLLESREWVIGYAPPDWTGLTDWLRKGPLPVTDQELLDAGLALTTRRGTVVDRFRDRVMFGIRNGTENRRVVGFIGRRPPHADAGIAKYLNTPKGLVFDKGRFLFGLSEQRARIQSGGRPMLVEGPLDVLAVAGLGLDVVPISACGTALSVRQSQQLQPFLRRGGLVAYDGDEAGEGAALNAHERLFTYTDDLRGVQLPWGEDPASLAVTTPQVLRRLIEHAPPLTNSLLQATVAHFLDDLDNAEIRVSALHSATRLLARLQAADTAGQVAWLSNRLGFSPQDVTTDLTDALTEARSASATDRKHDATHTPTANRSRSRSLYP
jgi:DNA primase